MFVRESSCNKGEGGEGGRSALFPSGLNHHLKVHPTRVLLVGIHAAGSSLNKHRCGSSSFVHHR